MNRWLLAAKVLDRAVSIVADAGRFVDEGRGIDPLWLGDPDQAIRLVGAIEDVKSLLRETANLLRAAEEQYMAAQKEKIDG